MPMASKRSANSHEQTWLQKLGILGALFFLIKGLLWLIVPILLVYLGVNQD